VAGLAAKDRRAPNRAAAVAVASRRVALGSEDFASRLTVARGGGGGAASWRGASGTALVEDSSLRPGVGVGWVFGAGFDWFAFR